MPSTIKYIPIPWHEQYGNVIKFDGPVGVSDIPATDPLV